MTKYTDRLWNDLVRESGPALAQADRPQAGQAPFYRRPRVIAGSTLAVAAVGLGLAYGLTSPSSPAASPKVTRTTTDAYTITQVKSGSVLVQINDQESINVADDKLNQLIKEEVVLRMASGPAPADGALTCSPGVKNMGGPTVKVLLGANGTQVIKPGTTGDNTGVGTWHMLACYVYPSADMGDGGTGSGNSGNTGNG